MRGMPEFFYRFLRQAEVEIIEKGPLAKDFATKHKEIIPIIFSHGLGSSKDMHSALLRDYASHGYLVFAINHGENSCSYTFDKNGRPFYYDNS